MELSKACSSFTAHADANCTVFTYRYDFQAKYASDAVADADISDNSFLIGRENGKTQLPCGCSGQGYDTAQPQRIH
jgi:hypothetical protein